MKTILLPARKRVFKDKYLKEYKKQWLWPLTPVTEHTRYEPEEPSLFWLILGPVGLLVLLISAFMSKQIKVTVYKMENENA